MFPLARVPFWYRLFSATAKSAGGGEDQGQPPSRTGLRGSGRAQGTHASGRRGGGREGVGPFAPGDRWFAHSLSSWN